MASPFRSRLHVPQSPSRPGREADFAAVPLPPPEAGRRPEVMTPAEEMRDLADGLVRVLDDQGVACGPWDPGLDPGTLQRALRLMVLTRVYDDRMFRMQRQGKLSFYMKSTGEEAVAVGQGLALAPTDMLFPSYRQQGLLLVRGRKLVDMMCACLSNSRDNQKGRQLPVLYGWKEGNYFSVSGNLATHFAQAVGWAMASAYKGEEQIASAWIGEGSTAEADAYNALLFASAYRAPVILNIVNNQWAISTPQTLASCGMTFASRGLGFDIPGIRVDGNDLPAVYAVTRWAAERARAGFGPTLVELFTYRAEAHSSSDNPGAYRSADDWRHWPLGDPVNRLQRHLATLGAWDPGAGDALLRELEREVEGAWAEAESFGTLEAGPHWPVASMFDDVFKEIQPHLRRQRREMEMDRG